MARSEKLVLAVLFAGVLLGALDIAIVGPALPAIREEFAVGSRSLSWVFSIYVLFYLVGAPLLGKLSDRRGRRGIYALCLALFAAGSWAAAAAPSFGWLLAARAVQAFGAGGIFPVASAVIGEVVPIERRGKTLGLIGAVFGLAFLLGPLLGGLLLPWGWRWLFVINVPLAILLIALGVRHVPQSTAVKPGTFDGWGAALLSVALAGLVFGLSQLDTAHVGPSLLSPRVWPFLLAAVIAVPIFWAVEKRAADPVIHPDLLRSTQLRVVVSIALAAGLVEAGMVFLPDIAVVAFGVEASQASFMMLPLVLTLTVGAPLAGQLLDRAGARIVVQSGLALTIAGLALFVSLPVTITSFYAAGVAIGFGLSGLLGAPLRYVTLKEAGAARRGAGQALLTVFVNIGQLVGAALIGGVVGSAGGALAGYRHALTVVAVACAAALVLSAALHGRVSAGQPAGGA